MSKRVFILSILLAYQGFAAVDFFLKEGSLYLGDGKARICPVLAADAGAQTILLPPVRVDRYRLSDEQGARMLYEKVRLAPHWKFKGTYANILGNLFGTSKVVLHRSFGHRALYRANFRDHNPFCILIDRSSKKSLRLLYPLSREDVRGVQAFFDGSACSPLKQQTHGRSFLHHATSWNFMTVKRGHLIERVGGMSPHGFR